MTHDTFSADAGVDRLCRPSVTWLHLDKVFSEGPSLRVHRESFPSKLWVSADVRTSANWLVRETDDGPNINTSVRSKMAVQLSPARRQVGGLQRAKTKESLSWLSIASSKSRISEMLISLRGRRSSKSAVSSRMILVSLGRVSLNYCT